MVASNSQDVVKRKGFGNKKSSRNFKISNLNRKSSNRDFPGLNGNVYLYKQARM